MGWENVQSDWQRNIARVRIKWPKLTEDDLHHINGRREALIDKIQQRYKLSEVQADDQVQTFEKYM